jgi:hypothetical protein
VLAALFVGALASAGEFDDVEHRLDSIEQWLDTNRGTDGHDPHRRPLRWSSPTRTSWPVLRASSSCTALPWPWIGVT